MMSNDLNLGDLGITINVSEGEPASAEFTLPDGSVVTRPFDNGELNMRLGLGLGLGYQPAVGGGEPEPVPEAGPAPAYRHHNFAAAAISTATLDVAYPTGIAAGDIMLLAVLHDPVGGTGVSLNIPAGFARIGTEQTTPGGRKTSLLWKRATGAEAGNLTVTLNGTMAASRVFSATLAAYSGCLAGGDPIDHFSEKGVSVAAPATATMNTITTTGANRRCVSFFMETSNDNDTSGAPASGWTVRGSNTSTTGFDSAIFFYDTAQASAGSPVDNFISVSGVQEFGIHAVALKPNPA